MLLLLKFRRYKLYIFSFLAILTIVIHNFIPAYNKTGEQLLLNNSFSKGDKHWTVKGNEKGQITITPNLVKLQLTNPKHSTQLLQTLDNTKLTQHVILQATVKSEDLVSGQFDWNKGRVLLVQYLNKKAVWNTKHSLISVEQTTEWQYISGTFEIHDWSQKASIIAEMNRSTGKFFCKDLELYNAKPNSVYTIFKYCLLMLWLLFVIFLLYPYILSNTSSKKILPLLIILAALSIIVGVTLPSNIKNNAKEKIESQVNQYKKTIAFQTTTQVKEVKNSFNLKASKIDITKLGHFGLFALLTAALCWQNQQSTHLEKLGMYLDLLLLASTTELSQFFIEDRSPLFTDIGIDMTGCLFGLFIYEALTIGKSHTSV